jgi:hypothetical protein
LATTEFEYFPFCFALLYDDDDVDDDVDDDNDDDDDDPLSIQFFIATFSVSSAMKQNIKILLKNYHKKRYKI